MQTKNKYGADSNSTIHLDEAVEQVVGRCLEAANYEIAATSKMTVRIMFAIIAILIHLGK